MKEHENNIYTKDDMNKIRKYLLSIISRYFDINKEYTKEEEESIIIEAYTRLKEELNALIKDYVICINNKSGTIDLSIEDLNGEPAFKKRTAFNKDFDEEEKDIDDTVVKGNDHRLFDAREPLYHIHNIDDINGLREALDALQIKSKDVHYHDNQRVLDMLRYAGKMANIDLILLEDLIDRTLKSIDRFKETDIYIYNIYRKFVNNFVNIAADVEKLVKEVQEYINTHLVWLEESESFTDYNIARIKNTINKELENYLSKKEFDKLYSVLDNAPYLIETITKDIPESNFTLVDYQSENTNIKETDEKILQETGNSIVSLKTNDISLKPNNNTISAINNLNSAKINGYFEYQKDGINRRQKLPAVISVNDSTHDHVLINYLTDSNNNITVQAKRVAEFNVPINDNTIIECSATNKLNNVSKETTWLNVDEDDNAIIRCNDNIKKYAPVKEITDVHNTSSTKIVSYRTFDLDDLQIVNSEYSNYAKRICSFMLPQDYTGPFTLKMRTGHWRGFGIYYNNKIVWSTAGSNITDPHTPSDDGDGTECKINAVQHTNGNTYDDLTVTDPNTISPYAFGEHGTHNQDQAEAMTLNEITLEKDKEYVIYTGECSAGGTDSSNFFYIIRKYPNLQEAKIISGRQKVTVESSLTKTDTAIEIKASTNINIPLYYKLYRSYNGEEYEELNTRKKYSFVSESLEDHGTNYKCLLNDSNYTDDSSKLFDIDEDYQYYTLINDNYYHLMYTRELYTNYIEDLYIYNNNEIAGFIISGHTQNNLSLIFNNTNNKVELIYNIGLASQKVIQTIDSINDINIKIKKDCINLYIEYNSKEYKYSFEDIKNQTNIDFTSGRIGYIYYKQNSAVFSDNLYDHTHNFSAKSEEMFGVGLNNISNNYKDNLPTNVYIQSQYNKSKSDINNAVYNLTLWAARVPTYAQYKIDIYKDIDYSQDSENAEDGTLIYKSSQLVIDISSQIKDIDVIPKVLPDNKNSKKFTIKNAIIKTITDSKNQEYVQKTLELWIKRDNFESDKALFCENTKYSEFRYPEDYTCFNYKIADDYTLNILKPYQLDKTKYTIQDKTYNALLEKEVDQDCDSINILEFDYSKLNELFPNSRLIFNIFKLNHYKVQDPITITTYKDIASDYEKTKPAKPSQPAIPKEPLDNDVITVKPETNTFIAPETKDPYMVLFNSQGSSTPFQFVYEGDKATKPSNPFWQGHTFDNWYTDASFTTLFDFNTAITNDITLYGKFTINQYYWDVNEVLDGTKNNVDLHVTFDVYLDNILYFTQIDDFYQKLNYNTLVEIKNVKVADNYSYDGLVSGTLKGRVSGVASHDCTNFKISTAIYYTVQFNTGDGSTVQSQTILINKKATKPTDPTYSGYNFKGWYTNSNYTNTFDFNTAITKDITLYAKWEKQVVYYAVKFTDTDHRVYYVNYNVEENHKVSKPSDPSRNHYNFDDWYTDSSYKTKFDFNTLINQDTTIYAKWVAKKYINYSDVIDQAVLDTKYGYTLIKNDPKLKELYIRMYNMFYYNGVMPNGYEKDEYTVTSLKDGSLIYNSIIYTDNVIKDPTLALSLKMTDLNLKVSESVPSKIFRILQADCPELLIKPMARYYTDSTRVYYALTGYRHYTPSDISYMMSTCHQTFNNICDIIKSTYGIVYNAKAKNNKSYYTALQKKQIAKVIHDYIVTHSYYGNIKDNDNEDFSNKVYWMNQGMYPALSNYTCQNKYGCGGPVCASFATAFKWCCDQFGILALEVYGHTGAARDGNHAWNIVSYNETSWNNNKPENWQEVDVTWDNADTYDDVYETSLLSNYVLWSYFNVTTREIENGIKVRYHYPDGGSYRSGGTPRSRAILTSDSHTGYTKFPDQEAGSCTSNKYQYISSCDGGHIYGGF